MEELEAEMELEEAMSPNNYISATNGHGAGSRGNQYTSTSNQTRRPGPGSYLPAGAVPSQNGVLSPQAAEFWFPENRNCPCCKGFKHGCGCRAKGLTTCADPNCCDAATVSTSTLATSTNYNNSISTNNASMSYASSAQSLPPSQPPSRGPGGDPTVCRFFLSGNCRSGASCRFYHPTADSPISSATTGSGVRFNPQICVYFQQGYCQFGDNCRMSHGNNGRF